MNSEIAECDLLRLPERACSPDSRTHVFYKIDLRDQYEAIACFILNEDVPTEVAIHFETAKNLYLYAWLVYRFYPVAEQQALAGLEFALRERFQDFVAAEKEKGPKAIEPGLKKLLGHAIKGGFVRNENFSTREHWARELAKSRYSFQKSQEMRSAGINSWVEDESEIVVTQEDLDYDWLGNFQEIIPRIRNSYAHGSGLLYPAPVRRTFEMVSEIINQLYPKR
jgi:hypothetical protein